jgi:FtsH-binding integral membrane protein
MIVEYENLRKIHRQAMIMAIGMIAILGVYILVGELALKGMFEKQSFPFYNTLRYILMGIAAAVVISMNIVKNKMLSIENDNDTEKQDRNQAEIYYGRRLLTAFVVSYAFAESIAIFGLVLYILGQDLTELVAFCGVAFFLMMVHFPKYSDWESRLKDYLE